MLRNRMLGGVSFLPFYAPEDGTGAPAAVAGPAAAAVAPAAAAAAVAPAAGDAAAPGAAKTLAGGGGSEAAAAAAAALAATPGAQGPKFADNWREALAGEDKDALKDLAKYTDPNAMYKSLRDLQTKISKGELKAPVQPLPADATDAQKAEWRKANGLPENVDAYVKGLALPDGLVVGEADKPLVGSFAKLAEAKGWSQEQMNDAVSWFYQAQDQVVADRAAGDGKTRMASEVALRGEWAGADFEKNMNAVGAALAVLPGDFVDAMLTARTADGSMLGDTVGFNKAMAQIGRELNPAATIVPLGDGNAAKTIDAEIATIEKSMYDGNGTPNREYWGDEKKQARYRELIDTQQKMAARGKAA